MNSIVNRDLTTAQPAGFTVLALAQLFDCFNVRSDSRGAFSCLFVNRWLSGLIAIAASLAGGRGSHRFPQPCVQYGPAHARSMVTVHRNGELGRVV